MDLVTVATYSNSTIAEMAKNYLANEGIRAFVEEAVTGDMFHLGSEVKLQVATVDAERAQQLLETAEFHPEEAGADEEE